MGIRHIIDEVLEIRSHGCMDKGIDGDNPFFHSVVLIVGHLIGVPFSCGICYGEESLHRIDWSRRDCMCRFPW